MLAVVVLSGTLLVLAAVLVAAALKHLLRY
jgi:hypothetical protein